MTQGSSQIGLFYGSSTCYTEMAGEKIVECINALLKTSDAVQSFDIADESPSSMERFEYLILGMPTWDYGELQEDWDTVWDELDHLNLAGKKVALFGLGDQIGYPEWFLDAMGYLHSKVVNCGASPCGYWPISGYEFEASQALSEDGQAFVGLALDDENEFEQSPERISRWCEQVLSEFGLRPQP